MHFLSVWFHMQWPANQCRNECYIQFIDPFISFSSESGMPTNPICECIDIWSKIVTFYWKPYLLLYNLAMIPQLITQPLRILLS